jgi:hypothetical protein
MPVILETSSATLTSKPRLVFKPWMYKISTGPDLTFITEGTHRPHSSATLSEQAQPGKSALDTGNPIGELLDVSAEFLTEGQRSGILQVRTTDLYDLVESLCLSIEGISQLSQGRDEILADLKDGSNVHGGREGVVGALAHVNVVIGVDWLLRTEFTTEDLDRPVRNDLQST